jgi:Tol biopolymer transport system component
MSNSGEDIVRIMPGSEHDDYGQIMSFDVSPDSSKIVFSARSNQSEHPGVCDNINNLGGHAYCAYIMDIDGSNVVRLGNKSERLWLNPVWSSDGSKILFVGGMWSSTQRIFIIDSNGLTSAIGGTGGNTAFYQDYDANDIPLIGGAFRIDWK